jgi:nitroimidazol reductase NimA-like FMN-containing flavoprotein (pyridoxamine 5'-phosphate oxidase superfamily)
MNLTKRTELRRIPDGGSPDWETIHQMLDAGFLACVGFCVDGQPYVIPTLYDRDGEKLYFHGTARKVADPRQKIKSLRVISEHLIAGRWEDVRGPSEKELKATTVLEFLIEGASSKMRSGPPLSDESDYGVRVWAGILPLEIKSQLPVPDDRLIKGITLPDYVRHYEARLRGVGASQASNGWRRQEIRSCGGV